MLSVAVWYGIRTYRKSRLKAKHPELYRLYEQLERDRKAGRL